MPFRGFTSFVVRTEFGPAAVNADDASFELTLGDVSQVEWSAAAEWMDDMVVSDGLSFDRSKPRAERCGHYRMAEGVLEPGMLVTVLGSVIRSGERVLGPDPKLGRVLSVDPDFAEDAPGRRSRSV